MIVLIQTRTRTRIRPEPKNTETPPHGSGTGIQTLRVRMCRSFHRASDPQMSDRFSPSPPGVNPDLGELVESLGLSGAASRCTGARTECGARTASVPDVAV
ncbi:unnamed protein product [Pleuronectes platessa]|uniref:Uncharacterized protein n=1 Tax=Pleuronectes platessa TaxID=8262 RepID=A0A9N7TZY8_PLEPL|nr:unnamed protein product [Pleuronectes platessa]